MRMASCVGVTTCMGLATCVGMTTCMGVATCMGVGVGACMGAGVIARNVVCMTAGITIVTRASNQSGILACSPDLGCTCTNQSFDGRKAPAS